MTIMFRYRKNYYEVGKDENRCFYIVVVNEFVAFEIVFKDEHDWRYMWEDEILETQ